MTRVVKEPYYLVMTEKRIVESKTGYRRSNHPRLQIYFNSQVSDNGSLSRDEKDSDWCTRVQKITDPTSGRFCVVAIQEVN